MKVKIFTGNLYNIGVGKALDDKINDFIKDKKVIDIKQSMVADSTQGQAYLPILITVLYED